MIVRFIFGLILGCIITLHVAQKDPWGKQKVGKAFTQLLADTFDCQVSGTILFFDIFSPRLFMADFAMKAHDDSWEWSTQLYKAGFSWRDIIKQRCIAWWTQMKGIEAHSTMKGTIPAILPHIQELMKGPILPIPLVLNAAKMHSGTLTITEDESKTRCRWYCDAHREGSAFCLKLQIRDGSSFYKEDTYLSGAHGLISITTQSKKNENDIDYAIQLDVKGELPQLGEYPICFLTGNWYRNSGRFQLQSYDRSLRINPLIIGKQGDDLYIETYASFPLSYAYKLIGKQKSSPLEGLISVKLKGSLSERGSLDGYLVCEEVIHASLPEMSMFNATFSKRAGHWYGGCDLKYGLNQTVHGSFEWLSSKQKGTASLFNETVFAMPAYHRFIIHPHDAQLHFSYDGVTNNIDGVYSIAGYDETNDVTIESSGRYIIDEQLDVTAYGKVGSYHYAVSGSLVFPYLSSLKILNTKKSPMLEWQYNADAGHYQSIIDFSLLQNISSSFFHYNILGEGKICCTGTKKEHQLFLQCALEDATIRLPQTFNFINGVTVDIIADFLKKRLFIKNLLCSLHNGAMKSSQGSVWFDEKGSLSFIHMPFFIDRCLVTAKQDLFAEISGNLLFSKKYDDPFSMTGNIMIDRAQLKENLFSEQLQKKLFLAAGTLRESRELPLICDVTIETKDPIRVDTPFLEANAHAHLKVQGSTYHPLIEGTVQVPSGMIKFPYKPLNITKGAITFVKEQPFNPLVDLVAKNKIKNHLITLNVTGALQDTSVLLEATPPLTEEQIVALLIAGAHEESLDAIIPALLMQNVTHYIFSSHKSNFFDHYIKPWMKQVNVSLKPNFSDQSARGGLRGTLEVVVNDRWRALIEKNFSLTEDTHFELEYILSDDITLRVIRDERRDVGGEVEMKWKF